MVRGAIVIDVPKDLKLESVNQSELQTFVMAGECVMMNYQPLASAVVQLADQSSICNGDGRGEGDEYERDRDKTRGWRY